MPELSVIAIHDITFACDAVNPARVSASTLQYGLLGGHCDTFPVYGLPGLGVVGVPGVGPGIVVLAGALHAFTLMVFHGPSAEPSPNLVIFMSVSTISHAERRIAKPMSALVSIYFAL